MKTFASKNKHKISSESGQSIIEFTLVLLGFFTMFFMFFRTVLNFAVGHYVHYATFMSARAYYAGGRSPNDQRNAGNATLAAYVGQEGTRFGLQPNEEAVGGEAGTVPGSTVGAGPDFQAGNRSWWWNQGVAFSFRSPMYLFPLIGIASRGSANELQLTSESWLGRDVTHEECDTYMTQRARPWLYDNGC